MKKLIYQEIFNILKNNFDVSDFATEDIEAPDNFEYSNETQCILDIHNQCYEAYVNHPGYNRREKQDEEFNILKEAWIKCISPYDLMHKEYYNSLGIGPFKVIDKYGGEGKGDEWWKVFYFEDHDVYMKITGWHTSHHGVDFDGWEEASEVRPIEKTITVYE